MKEQSRFSTAYRPNLMSETMNFTQVFKVVGRVYVGYVQELTQLAPLTGMHLSQLRERLSCQLADYLQENHPQGRFSISGMLLFTPGSKPALPGKEAYLPFLVS